MIVGAHTIKFGCFVRPIGCYFAVGLMSVVAAQPSKADSTFKCGNSDVKQSVENDAGLLFGKLFSIYMRSITIDPNAVHFKLSDTYEVSIQSDTKQCAGNLREASAPQGTAVPVQYHVIRTDEGNILYGLDEAAFVQQTKGLITAVAAGQIRFDFMDNPSKKPDTLQEPNEPTQNTGTLSGTALIVAEQAKTINKLLRKDLDASTTLTRLTASGSTLIYHYKIRGNATDKKTILDKKAAIAKITCSSPAAVKDFASGIVHEYRVSDSSQSDFAVFSIGIEDCDNG